MVLLKAKMEGRIFNLNSVMGPAAIKINEIYGECGLDEVCVINEGDYYYIVYNIDAIKKFGKEILTKFVSNSASFEKWISRSAKSRQEFLEVEQIIMKTDLFSTTKEKLLELYEKLIKAAEQVYVYHLPVGESIGLVAPQLLKSKVKDDELYSAVTYPSWKTYLREEEEARQEIIEKVRSGLEVSSPKISRMIKKHVSEFGFVFGSYANAFKADEKYFEKLIINSLEEELNSREELLKRKKEILKKFNSIEIEKIVRIIDVVAEFHDKRKLLMIKLMYYTKQIFSALSRFLDASVEDLMMVEFDAVIKGERIRELAKDREYAFIQFTKEGTNIYTGADYIKKKKDIFGEIDSGKLKGIPVSSGVVSGTARVILVTKEFPKFIEGEILISSHTTPDWLPIMRKAKAIVTERGGITCHAAIVARELKKPCIVGVSDITRILKSGDLVEIDGRKGFIKIK